MTAYIAASELLWPHISMIVREWGVVVDRGRGWI